MGGRSQRSPEQASLQNPSSRIISLSHTPKINNGIYIIAEVVDEAILTTATRQAIVTLLSSNVSLPVPSIVFAQSVPTNALSFLVVPTKFAPATVILTVAIAVPSLPSFTRYVKLSLPQ
jgi:hypothetical protein